MSATILRTLAEQAQKVAAAEWLQETYEDGDDEGGGYGVYRPGSLVLGLDPRDDDGPYDEFDAGNAALAAYFVALHPTKLLALLDEIERLQAEQGRGR